MRLLLYGAITWCIVLVGCGLFNKMAADSGNERAATPEARDLAARADKATKDWLDYLLYGILPTVVGGVGVHQYHKRRKSTAAKVG